VTLRIGQNDLVVKKRKGAALSRRQQPVQPELDRRPLGRLADTYRWSLPGQKLNVTGLRRARYCLVSTADPHNLLRESDNSNDARRTRMLLRPAKRKVKRLRGQCRMHL
jgi:hypothetical protein